MPSKPTLPKDRRHVPSMPEVGRQLRDRLGADDQALHPTRSSWPKFQHDRLVQSEAFTHTEFVRLSRLLHGK